MTEENMKKENYNDETMNTNFNETTEIPRNKTYGMIPGTVKKEDFEPPKFVSKNIPSEHDPIFTSLSEEIKNIPSTKTPEIKEKESNDKVKVEKSKLNFKPFVKTAASIAAVGAIAFSAYYIGSQKSTTKEKTVIVEKNNPVNEQLITKLNNEIKSRDELLKEIKNQYITEKKSTINKIDKLNSNYIKTIEQQKKNNDLLKNKIEGLENIVKNSPSQQLKNHTIISHINGDIELVGNNNEQDSHYVQTRNLLMENYGINKNVANRLTDLIVQGNKKGAYEKLMIIKGNLSDYRTPADALMTTNMTNDNVDSTKALWTKVLFCNKQNYTKENGDWEIYNDKTYITGALSTSVVAIRTPTQAIVNDGIRDGSEMLIDKITDNKNAKYLLMAVPELTNEILHEGIGKRWSFALYNTIDSTRKLMFADAGLEKVAEGESDELKPYFSFNSHDPNNRYASAAVVIGSLEVDAEIAFTIIGFSSLGGGHSSGHSGSSYSGSSHHGGHSGGIVGGMTGGNGFGGN